MHNNVNFEDPNLRLFAHMFKAKIADIEIFLQCVRDVKASDEIKRVGLLQHMCLVYKDLHPDYAMLLANLNIEQKQHLFITHKNTSKVEFIKMMNKALNRSLIDNSSYLINIYGSENHKTASSILIKNGIMDLILIDYYGNYNSEDISIAERSIFDTNEMLRNINDYCAKYYQVNMHIFHGNLQRTTGCGIFAINVLMHIKTMDEQGHASLIDTDCKFTNRPQDLPAKLAKVSQFIFKDSNLKQRYIEYKSKPAETINSYQKRNSFYIYMHENEGRYYNLAIFQKAKKMYEKTAAKLREYKNYAELKGDFLTLTDTDVNRFKIKAS